MRAIWTGIVLTLGSVALAAACNRNNQNEPSDTDRNIEPRPEYNAPSPMLPPPVAEPGGDLETEPMSGMDETERMGGGGGWGGTGGSQGWPGE